MMKKMFALTLILNTCVILAQSTDTSFVDCDLLSQDIMMYIKRKPFSNIYVHIIEEKQGEQMSVKDDYRYVKYIPRPWRYNFKLSIQRNFTGEEINNLINNIQEQASKETQLSENRVDRVCDSSPLIYPWNEVYDFMTKYKDWVIGESRIRCNHCLKKTMLIYYITPDYTWRRRCGRAGYFLVCPHCLNQLDFYYMVLN